MCKDLSRTVWIIFTADLNYYRGEFLLARRGTKRSCSPACRFSHRLQRVYDFLLRFQIRNGCIAEIVLRYKDYFYQYNATKDPYQNITGLRFYAYSALARSYDLIKLDFVCPDWQLRFNSKSGRSIPGQFRRYDVYAREVAWKSDGVRYSLMIHRSMHPLGTVLDLEKKYKSIDNYTDLFNLAQKAVQQDVR